MGGSEPSGDNSSAGGADDAAHAHPGDEQAHAARVGVDVAVVRVGLEAVLRGAGREHFRLGRLEVVDIEVQMDLFKP